MRMGLPKLLTSDQGREFHESSLHTPFELMFGRRTVIPIDVETEKKEGNELLHEYLTNTSVS